MTPSQQQPTATLTDLTARSSVAAIPAGASSQLPCREKFNHGAPWARQWIRDQIERAQRMNEKTEGLL